LQDYPSIGQQISRTFVLEANTSCPLIPNLNTGGLLFFPDLYTVVSRLWEKAVSYGVYSSQTSHYSSISNYKGRCQRLKRRSQAISPLNQHLPSKPRYIHQTSWWVKSALLSKAYSVAGQAAACLHTGVLIQICLSGPPRRWLNLSAGL